MIRYDCAASGIAIAEAREEQGLSQGQLGAMVGCSATSISRIELGEDINQPRYHKLRALAEQAAKLLHIDLVAEDWSAVRCLTCAKLHVFEVGSLRNPRRRGVCMHYGDGIAHRGCTHYQEVLE